MNFTNYILDKSQLKLINISSAIPECREFNDSLSCFLKQPSFANKQYAWSDFKVSKYTNYQLVQFTLYSQIYPMGSEKIWYHPIELYLPEKLEHSTALLYVGAGANYDSKGTVVNKYPVEKFDYAKIAVEAKTIVVKVLYVPNQFISLDGNKYIKEDYFLAKTFSDIIDNPEANRLLAGHFPMTKTAIKTMDVVQEVMQDKYDRNIDNFVVVGASKRGWAGWLTAIIDDRVSAVIPMVIDVLNVAESLKHICSFYSKCPPVLKPFKDANITDRLDTENGKKLLDIEDPYSYILREDYNAKFASIPKIVISYASDDFFVPNSNKLYFSKLPGNNNSLHIFANSPHYITGNAISDNSGNKDKIESLISSFLYYHLHNISLPKINWTVDQSNVFTINASPVTKDVKQYIAHSTTHDFRCIKAFSPLSWFIKFNVRDKILSYFRKDLCDTIFNAYEQDDLSLIVNQHDSGWIAHYFEICHVVANNKIFCQTTDINIFELN